MDRGILKATTHWGANYVIRGKKKFVFLLPGVGGGVQSPSHI